MKKLYVFVVALSLSVAAFSQNIIDDHYSDLKDSEENTYVFVSGRLFDLASNFIPEDEEIEELGNLKEFVSTIESFQLVVAPDLIDPKAEYRKGVADLKRSYEELILIRDQEHMFSFYVDESNGIVNELVGIGVSENDFIVFTLNGAIDLDQIGKLINEIKSHKINKITPRNTVNIDEMKIYPNPSNTGNIMNIEVPQEMMGGKIRVYNLDGALIKDYIISESIQQISTDGFIPGNYIIEIQKDAISMKKKAIVIK